MDTHDGGLGRERVQGVAAGPAAYSSGRGRVGLRTAVPCLVGLLALACLVVGSAAALPERFTARVEKVLDGDSLELLRDGAPVTVRLFGIDCPEWEQPHGPAAARFARALAAGARVVVRVRGTDVYGRLLADVALPDGRSLNRELVRAGHAWWYRRYADDPELERLEAEARTARRGLWAAPDPVAPWRWRRRHPRRSH